MIVMDLPNLPTTSKSNSSVSGILCLVLSEATVQALHIEISPSGVEIVSESRAVAYTDPKQCVIQVDQCLGELDKTSESVNKVVFALNHSWIKEGDVTDEYKPLLRNITTDLSLDPLGFIDETESISQYLLNQESSFSGLVIVVGVTSLSFAHLADGKQKGIEAVGRSDNFKSDAIEGLTRFANEAQNTSQFLPANIVLASFDAPESDLQDYKQQVLLGDFGESFRFLQSPVVRTISDQQYLAMISGAAGKAAAIATGIKITDTSAPARLEDQTTTPEDPAEFGFETFEPQQDEPVAESSSEIHEPETAAPTATSFGVPISSELPEIPKKDQSKAEKELEILEDDDPDKPLSIFAKITRAWKKPYQGKHGKIFFALTGLLLGLVFVAIGLLSYFYSTATASVTIYFEKKPISKDANIIIDSEAEQSDPGTQTLAASTMEKTVSEKGSIPTTGVKIVGDKAKGSIIIFNKTTATKTFAPGTTFKIGDLAYSLDEEIVVASASVQEKPGGAETKYGQAQTKVTASDIGADYNKEKEVKMSVANFASDTYEAEVDKEGIAGGASREVRIVAEEDAEALLAELRTSLLATANKEMVDEAESGQYIVPSQTIASQKPKYSFKVGDESDLLELDLEVTVNALTYTVEDLKPLVREILGGEVPEGYELFEEDPQILTDNTAESSPSASVKKTLTARVSSFAIPIIDPENLKNEIDGQSVTTAINSLKNKESISDVEVLFVPDWIKIIRKNLPVAQKIELKTMVK